MEIQDQDLGGWRAWIVNTQLSDKSGSHWFVVAVGVHEETEDPDEEAAAGCRALEKAAKAPCCFC